MQVSVETLNGLERKVTVSVPTEKVEEQVGLRLRELARNVKVDGFRPGKAPFNIVEKRFSQRVREEVAGEMIRDTLWGALQDQKLVPAGSPFIEPKALEKGKDFTYTATFEVFPEVQVQELDDAEIEMVNAKVQDSDVEEMLTKLREQSKEWHVVERKVQEGDKVKIDFKGFIGDEPFAGGEAQDYELVIGSGSMIPGFESGLIGAELNKPFDITVNFPADYGHDELAGKEARFNITVKEIQEGKLPELDDVFAEKFNIKEGGMDALRKDIRENMERELERRVSSMNRERVFNKLVEKNPIDLPSTLIDNEIENLKHDMYHRIFGHEHHENEKIPDFPRELFEEQARKRVHLGLLFAEYVKKHEIKADSDRVDAMIEKFASAYESPEELRNYYRSSKERLAEVEALVTEEMVAEKIGAAATITHKEISYNEVMNPKQEQDQSEGE